MIERGTNKPTLMMIERHLFFTAANVVSKLLFFGSLLFLTATPIVALVPSCHSQYSYTSSITGLMVSSGGESAETTADGSSTRAPPRTGFAQTLLNFALESPLWKLILVPKARATMVETAEANQIPWTAAKKWIQSQIPLAELDDELHIDKSSSSTTIPSYYQKEFHAYETGNLSWEAAFEVEIASAAVGARNFPEYGSKGEDAFRGAFESALIEGGAKVPTKGGNGRVDDDVIRIIDFGCGTGMSTRRLAKNFPQADTIIGVDLSPYFVSIGKKLLELTPSSFHEGGPWVSTIESDSRIEYVVGDVAKTSKLKDLGDIEGKVDVVNLQFVLHELPPDAARDIIDEAFRLLRSNGQLWICEMDFEAPAYAAQRANPLLFSLIRSTEPYLDDYAESISDLLLYVQGKSQLVTVLPATGRHFALVATKGPSDDDSAASTTSATAQNVMEDLRFDEDGNYRVEDTHLPTFKSKSETKI
jgi:SAM-dependent methyltransferase